MQGDFSRLTFDPARHYSGVRMQQGRLQLDADWNEQMDILTHRFETEVGDFLGASAVPAAVNGGNSFALLTDGPSLRIGAGRCYVAGKLFENDADVAFASQPDYPGARAALEAAQRAAAGGEARFIAYLDAWQRHIPPAEEPSIVEVALGGADTATRVKNVWQVRLQAVEGEVDPVALRRAWADARPQLGSGRLKAWVASSAPALENQLYRVEVHAATTEGAVLKWSRDNGSVAEAVQLPVDRAGQVVTLRSAGRDVVRSFQPGDWVELTTWAQTLEGRPGALVQVGQVQGRQLIIGAESWAAAGLADAAVSLEFDMARRWDMGAAGPPRARLSGPVELEHGIWVSLERDEAGAAAFRSGDYWLIPARTLTGDIEWPRRREVDAGGRVSYAPLAREPHGVRHYSVPLALLICAATGDWRLDEDGDLRPLFAAMREGLVSKAGDTMTGKLTIEHDLEVSRELRIGGGPLTVGRGERIGLLGTWASPQGMPLVGLAVEGQYAYTCNPGVFAIDISRPEQPRHIAALDSFSRQHIEGTPEVELLDCAVHGGHLLISANVAQRAGQVGPTIIKLSLLPHPEGLKEIQSKGMNIIWSLIMSVGAGFILGGANHVVQTRLFIDSGFQSSPINDGAAYEMCVVDSNCMALGDGVLYIINNQENVRRQDNNLPDLQLVKEASANIKIGKLEAYRIDRAYPIKIAAELPAFGARVACGEATRGLLAFGRLLYAGMERRLVAMRHETLSAAPVTLGQVDLGETVLAIAGEPARLCVLTSRSLVTIDMSDPARPRVGERWPVTSPKALVVRGDYAYITAGSQLQVYGLGAVGGKGTNPGEGRFGAVRAAVLSVEANLDVRGRVSFDRRPIRVERYYIGQTALYDTGYSSVDWVAIVAGVNMVRDAPPVNGSFATEMVDDGTWKIRTNSISISDNVQVTVAFIDAAWVDNRSP